MEADEPREPLVERLNALDSCVVSDALDALGLDGTVEAIGPVWEGARVAGRAVTMELAAGPTPPGGPTVHLGVAAILQARPGDVIVIANGGRVGMGSWGGLLSAAARTRGIAGVVTDGACRDVDEARAAAFPVFARAAVARTARGRAHEVAVGDRITIGGVAVNSGDLLLADASGIVVIAADRAVDVLALSEEFHERETQMLSDIRSGVRLDTVLGVRYETMISASGDRGGPS